MPITQRVTDTVQPPMSKMRVKLIRMAFAKLDKDNSGNLTWEDLKGCARDAIQYI